MTRRERLEQFLFGYPPMARLTSSQIRDVAEQLDALDAACGGEPRPDETHLRAILRLWHDCDPPCEGCDHRAKKLLAWATGATEPPKVWCADVIWHDQMPSGWISTRTLHSADLWHFCPWCGQPRPAGA